MIWIWFIAKIIFNICFAAIQNGSKSNKVMSACYQLLGGWDYVKFTVECVMCMEKHISVEKMFTNGLTMGLPI